ncbi:molybdopterin-containing oxidoreductase family protein [Mycobacterium kyogaense]|uniref:molybdopterin-containing oxidoreductase family protein n=1 Tax=Mycobacterium kyogaense TaxID=2212479 RepID=UPI000DAD04C6|nr:molybdopterin-dependent oxidoreductase [Mycobacterium kyogaense]
MREEKVTFCRICEPLCGLIATVDEGRLTSLRPDQDNPNSKGFACTKGVGMHLVVNDPDRVTVPLRRVGGPGEFEPTTWDQALGDIAARFARTRKQRGADSIAITIGNPMSFSYSAVIWSKGFQSAIGTPWYYGINSEDAASRIAAFKILYGQCADMPFPDYRRTDFMMIIGANPWVSKGSLVSDPRIREHLTDVVERGGRVVVVDPRRTETAKAFEHVAIRGGTDPWFLLSLLHVLVKRRLYDRSFVQQWTTGFDQWLDIFERFPPEVTEKFTGVPAATVVDLAETIGHAKAAVVYGRTGTCTQKFGTLTNVLQDFINIITGNLQRPGGWVFPWSPVPMAEIARATKLDTYDAVHTRVAHLPDSYGLLPANALADEITTPGKGQIRAMLLLASNCVVTSADSNRLADAMEQLETTVSLDMYVNETNRHAHYILPVTSMYEREDVALPYLDKLTRPSLQVTEAVIDPIGQCRPEWKILDEIARRMGLGSADSTWAQRQLARVGLRVSPRATADLLLRIGKSGDLFGLRRSGWSWRKLLERAPHGVVLHEYHPLGPLEEKIDTPDGKIALADPRVMSEMARLECEDAASADFPLRLIGMREMKSHNSWMHNSARLMPASRQLTVRISPADAADARLEDGDIVRITSKTGSVEVPVTVTADMTQGTIALPHGWGHNGGWKRANAAGGTSSNHLASSRPEDLERLAAMSILNGIPVRMERVSSSQAVPHGAIPSAESASKPL